MIKNDKQYAITKAKRDEFLQSITLIDESDHEDLLKKIMRDAIGSQVETLNLELGEYEKLRYQKPTVMFSEFRDFPETLTKLRIARGISQEELGRRIGVDAQQIQRYESNGYNSAKFDRMLKIAASLDVRFEQTKITLNQPILKVKGYDPAFLAKATQKLQMKRAMFTV